MCVFFAVIQLDNLIYLQSKIMKISFFCSGWMLEF